MTKKMNALLILGGMALTGLAVLVYARTSLDSARPDRGRNRNKKRSYHYPPERLQ